MAKNSHITATSSVSFQKNIIETLIGQKVLVFTTTYIYYGQLESIDDDFLVVSTPHIVYETGPFKDPKFTDAQIVAPFLCLSIGHIESIFPTTKVP